MGAFDFTQAQNSPALLTARQLYHLAHQQILALNADRTVASCSTAIPDWLPPLLGV